MLESSFCLPMRGGVRLAVDLALPDRAAEKSLGAVVRATRYWRATVGGDPERARLHAEEADAYTGAGFALVRVDVRGTGHRLRTARGGTPIASISRRGADGRRAGTRSWAARRSPTRIAPSRIGAASAARAHPSRARSRSRGRRSSSSGSRRRTTTARSTRTRGGPPGRRGSLSQRGTTPPARARQPRLPARPGAPLPDRQSVRIRFPLLPLSVTLAPGDRARLALFGHDRNFARIPEQGTPELTVERAPRAPSSLSLPIGPRR